MNLGFKQEMVYIPTDIKIKDDRAEGETIETKVERISRLNEPITDGAPYIETQAQDGVVPMYDIRTDPFDQALDEVTQIHSNSAQKYAEDMAKLNQKLQGGSGATEEGDASEA